MEGVGERDRTELIIGSEDADVFFFVAKEDVDFLYGLSII